MLYVGIAWITAFNKISLPAYDKNFNFQSPNLLQTLSLMLLKA